jgi:hypothetical protein
MQPYVGWALLFASVTCLQGYIRWAPFVLRAQPLDTSPLGLCWHNKHCFLLICLSVPYLNLRFPKQYPSHIQNRLIKSPWNFIPFQRQLGIHNARWDYLWVIIKYSYSSTFLSIEDLWTRKTSSLHPITTTKHVTIGEWQGQVCCSRCWNFVSCDWRMKVMDNRVCKRAEFYLSGEERLTFT